MAQIVLDIPNAQVARVIDALCVFGYDGDPDDQAARREFARNELARMLQDRVMQVERAQAYRTALEHATVDAVEVG